MPFSKTLTNGQRLKFQLHVMVGESVDRKLHSAALPEI